MKFEPVREDKAGKDKDRVKKASQGMLGCLSYPGGNEEPVKGFLERK